MQALSCDVQQVSLGDTAVIGSWPYIVALLSRKLFAGGRHLKNFHKFNKKASFSKIVGNYWIKCLKHNTSLWLLHLIHQSMGTDCSRWRFKPFCSPELTLVVSIHANLAFLSGISKSLGKLFRTDIIFTADKWVLSLYG